MRNLLLSSKWFATEAQSDTIQFPHFIKALECFDLQNAEAKSKLEALLEPHQLSFQVATETPPFDDSELEKIASAARLPYDSELNLLVMQMKAAGFGLDAAITDWVTVSVASANSANRYQNLLAQVSEVKALLKSKVFDQDTAVEAVSDAVMQMSWQDVSNRPRATFFFLGPPATGKTYLAQLLGQGLQGYAFKAFDMTQYSSEQESFGLVGLRKGFQDAGEGALTSFVKENPKSIVVFDELEKANTKIQSSLLRMFSEGYLQDQFTNEDVDFRETMVVFTSNLGSEIYFNPNFNDQIKSSPEQARETLLEVIRREKKLERGHQVNAVSPEMLSRISQGNVILFNRLTIEGLTRIATQQMQKEFKTFEKAAGIKIDVADVDALAKWSVLSFAPSFDVRAIKARLFDLLIDPITDYLLENVVENLSHVSISVAADIHEFMQQGALDELAKKLTHKHQVVKAQRTLQLQGQQLLLEFNQPVVEKLARGHDFGDASGIQVDLPEVRFSDIAGHHQIKTRLNEVIQQMQQQETLQKYGVNLPKGMLLFGPPGTGKTLLAKAFAAEAELPFIACSGNDLLDEKFIQNVFARAREYAPALIFIDEIDALPKRGAAGAYADALVNRLLVEIDGFKQSDEIFIIAATNRKENIDSAILRSGRIDLHLEVPQLDKDARRWFLETFFKAEPFEALDVERLVTFSAGLSGADMRKVHRESILEAMRSGVTTVSEERVLEQINTLKYGHSLNLKESDQRLQETAYHEAGHAVASMVLLPERKIEQLTVIPRKNSLGMLAFDSEQEDDYHRDFLFNLTCVALAGRAAQVKMFGSEGLDSGASGDLSQSMRYAYLAIAEWGMSDELFNLSPSVLNQISERNWFQERVEQQVEAWMKRATEQTNQLVEEHFDAIERIAQAVLKEETLDAKALHQLFKNT